MIALAFGPGSDVLMSGAFIGLHNRTNLPLFRFPPRRRTSVLEDDATRIEVLPDAIGLGEVSRLPCSAPRGNECLYLFDGHRRTRIFGTAQREHAKNSVEALECGLDPLRIGLRKIA